MVITKIFLKNDIDPIFFKLLNKLYKPFLSASHLKDRFKFTVFIKSVKYPVGIISINKGKNTFMQFAFIPKVRNSNVAQLSLKQIIKISGVKKVDWTCNKINYPSLKILYDFKGGLFDNSVKDKKRKSVEGFFRVDKPVSKNMRENLKNMLQESFIGYTKWLKEYNLRKDELEELNNYLKEYYISNGLNRLQT